MQKGFTLVELLAVILILAILSVITTVSVTRIMSSSRSSLSDTQKKSIEEAAEVYYIKEGNGEENSCIDVSDLISKGYIDAKEVKDPKTKETLTGSVKITYASNQYTYEYQDQNCSE